MHLNLKENMICTVETSVNEGDTAKKLGSGDLEVFATPAMIALMEKTAKSCVGLHLPCGYTTVGIQVDIKHIKASPVGMKIRCEARLTKVDEKKLFFNVEAWDDKGKIGEGTHVRYIVNEVEFMKRVNA